MTLKNEARRSIYPMKSKGELTKSKAIRKKKIKKIKEEGLGCSDPQIITDLFVLDSESTPLPSPLLLFL